MQTNAPDPELAKALEKKQSELRDLLARLAQATARKADAEAKYQTDLRLAARKEIAKADRAAIIDADTEIEGLQLLISDYRAELAPLEAAQLAAQREIALAEERVFAEQLVQAYKEQLMLLIEARRNTLQIEQETVRRWNTVRNQQWIDGTTGRRAMGAINALAERAQRGAPLDQV